MWSVVSISNVVGGAILALAHYLELNINHGTTRAAGCFYKVKTITCSVNIF